MDLARPNDEETADEISAMVDQIRQWLATSGGEEVKRRISSEGSPFSDELRRARQISPEELRIPVGL